MQKTAKIYIAGHTGLVGSAILRNLQSKGYVNIITPTHRELDLTNQRDVNSFFENEKPEYVFLAAAKVGGIVANDNYPVEFLRQNMMIGFNVVHAAYIHKVQKLINMGSSCIYPKMAEQPIREESLLTGPLEPTNDAYAIAKISVIKLCSSFNKQYGTNFLSTIPASIYGIGDNYDINNSHVIPALISKFHEAKVSGRNKVILWGDGSPLREFLYSDDLAMMLIALMELYDAKDIRHNLGDFINLGSGKEITIKNLAEIVRSVVYEKEISEKPAETPEKICRINWDKTKPNGTPRKVCDISRQKALGISAQTEFLAGIKSMYKDFLARNRDKE